MQRKLYATLCASAILAAGVTAASASSEHRRHHDGRHALRGVALTADQKLLSYRTDAPERARSVGRIRGMSGDTALVGIDYRPATGELYGLGDQGGVYVVDDRTAQATGGPVSACRWRGRLRRRLQPGRRPAADHQRHRPEPAPQRRRRRRHAQGRHPDLPGHAGGDRHRRDGRGVHEQRRRPGHGDDAVRPRHRARPGLIAVARQRRPARADRQARARRRRAERSTSTARSAVARPSTSTASPRSARTARSGLYGIELVTGARRRARLVPAAPRRGRDRHPDRAALTGRAARGRPEPAAAAVPGEPDAARRANAVVCRP